MSMNGKLLYEYGGVLAIDQPLTQMTTLSEYKST